MNPYAEVLEKYFEGFYRKPYVCPAGHWTIAWGHLCDKNHPPVTKGEGTVYLEQDNISAMSAVIKLCPGIAVDEKKFGAIIDFTFNLGSGRLKYSTLRRRINERNWRAVQKELTKWVYGGGRKLPGLVLRRDAESRLI